MFRKIKKRFGLGKHQEKLPEGVKVGRHTYGVTRASIGAIEGLTDIEIGSFCSVAKEVLFLQSEHSRETVSTWPFDRAFTNGHIGRDIRGPIKIGNDVWIGRRAIILSGVTIGDGAIIGAGSIVTKDVPPYAVAVGNPAKVVRYRFERAKIETLLKLRWWDWSDETIQQSKQLFLGPVDAFIERFANLR